MLQTTLYGFLSVIPLILGAVIGAFTKIKGKFVGDIAAFGAGALIAALTFGLMEEAFKFGGIFHSVFGFLVGGLFFIIGDLVIITIGGRGHKKYYSEKNTTGYGIVLGAVLDGLPESIVLGISLAINPKLGFLVLAAIILNNLPEAISSAHDLKRAGLGAKNIILIWSTVALVAITGVFLGFSVLAQLSPIWIAWSESLAAGAILAMLASTMMPEAYKESGLNASLATVLGFMIIFAISKF